jgi:hypothetical protein
MTQVTMDDGSKIETDLPAEAVADLQQPAEQPKPEETPNPAPEQPEKPAEPNAEKPTPEAPKPQAPVSEPAPSRKAKPIANLLAKNHDLEEQLETERKAKADLEAKLAQISEQPSNPQATADVKALADKYGMDENILADIVAAARNGIKPELPKEVQDLIAKQQEQNFVDAEMAGFEQDLGRLQKTFKDEASLADPKVRDRLLELAYSTDKAPDGEPYFQKPLHELYFSFIKPEVEPGGPSAEPSQGGSQQQTKVLDFQDIFDRDDPKDIEAMDDQTFHSYSKWLNEKQGDVPIRRKT